MHGRDPNEIIKGGQGRSASSIQDAAWILLVMIGGIGAVLATEFVVSYWPTLPLPR